MRLLVHTVTLILAILAAPPAPAQDRAGRDTPGEWIVDHYRPFGLWDSICDHRTTGDVMGQRCYLRYVEVFSPRPTFAAQFVFVTPGPEIEIGLERGTRFAPGGMRIEAGSATIWTTDRRGCMAPRLGSSCVFTGEDAADLLAALTRGAAFLFDFTDRHAQPQSLRWDLTRFAYALADFEREAAARGL